MSTKGVSEVVASVLIALVILAGVGIYFTYFSKMFQASSSGLIQMSNEEARESGQLLSLIYVQRQGARFKLHVYNYGFTVIGVLKVYINKVSYHFTLMDEDGNTIEYISPKAMAVIEVNGVLPSSSYEVVIVTDLGRTFTWKVG